MATSRALLIGIERYPHIVGADLDGPRNDVKEIYDLLRLEFGFPENNFDGVLEPEGEAPPTETTRDKVCAAFERLCEQTGDNDVVVIYYSGHGSRLQRDGQWVETIVPSDSGRAAPHGDGAENRDVEDHEIKGWIERLNRKTPHVTLIFDSCHSGSIHRDPFATGVREVPPDRRPPTRQTLPATRSLDGTNAATIDPGMVFDPQRTVLLAACRADEEAKELRPSVDGATYAHGAFTYHLVRALKNASTGATWRGLFEAVAPRVTAVYSSQHPQVEGRWDTAVFGVEEHQPNAYLPVKAIHDDGSHVTLAGGAVHGLAAGAVWSLLPASALHPEDGAPLARLEIETVAPAASVARVVERAEGAHLETGLRAFLLEQRLPRAELTLAVDLDNATDKDRRRVTRGIERADLLRDAVDGETVDVKLYCLAPRATIEDGMPCPLLGPLTEPTWAAVGADGRLIARHRPTADGVSGLLADIERVARHRGLLAVDNPAAANPLDGKVEMSLKRWRDGTFVDAEPEPGDGLVRLAWSDGFEVVITSRHDAPLWVSLLVFSCDMSIGQLLPNRDHSNFARGGYRLEAGHSLAVAADYGSKFRKGAERGLEFTRPSGFPWAAEPGTAESATALYHLRMMVTDGRADFEFVCQGGTRDPGAQGHPALELAELYSSGQGRRDVPAVGEAITGWTTLTRSLIVG